MNGQSIVAGFLFVLLGSAFASSGRTAAGPAGSLVAKTPERSLVAETQAIPPGFCFAADSARSPIRPCVPHGQIILALWRSRAHLLSVWHLGRLFVLALWHTRADVLALSPRGLR
jgi:hypothetical protein